MYLWIFRTRLIIQSSFSSSSPWEQQKFPRKLNEWLALRIVGASPLSACYHRPSSEARSSGLANLDPSCGGIFWPRFHPAPTQPHARGGVRGRERVCVLSGYFTDMWRKRGNNGMKPQRERETDRMPGIRIDGGCKKLKHAGVKSAPSLVCMQIREKAEADWANAKGKKKKKSGKIQIHAVWESRITNGFSSLRASH